MPDPPRPPAKHLGRVHAKVGALLADFFRERGVGARFHLGDVEAYVGARSNVVPGSAARVMRMLRGAGVLGYRLVSRTESLYEVTAWAPAPPSPPASGSLFDPVLFPLGQTKVR